MRSLKHTLSRILIGGLIGVMLLAAYVWHLLCPSVAAAGDLSSLRLSRCIPMPNVSGRIDHMAIDSKGHRLFVAALGNNTLEVLDLQAGQVVQSLGDLQEPQGVAFLPDSGKLIVASGGDGKVHLYDASLRRVATLDGLDDADNVRYDAGAKLAYVGYGGGALAVIDPEKAAKVADIPLDGHPESFQLERQGNRIYVNVPRHAAVEVIDREKRKVIARWPLNLAGANFPMALDEAHHRLFVGCRLPATLAVVDTTSGTTMAKPQIVGDTDDVFYDPASKRIYASGGGGAISVIEQTDADHYAPIATIPTASGARTSLFSAEDRTLYIGVPRANGQNCEIRVMDASEREPKGKPPK